MVEVVVGVGSGHGGVQRRRWTVLEFDVAERRNAVVPAAAVAAAAAADDDAAADQRVLGRFRVRGRRYAAKHFFFFFLWLLQREIWSD